MQYINYMYRPGILRVIQWITAIVLIIGISFSWHFNAIGQNLINITACIMFLVGLDNIIVYYRCYIQKSAFEAEATFIIFCLFMLGIIFENFNKSYGSNLITNIICKYSIIVVLALNVSYYAFVLITLLAFLIRQIYRLMAETLLNAGASIDRSQLQRFLNQNRTPYQQILIKYPAINNSCSICLIQFENRDQCVVIPSCQHCFHQQCLAQWLGTKSTCPYCRHNIQLDILLENSSDQ